MKIMASIQAIDAGKLRELDVKRMQGYKNTYRCRVGDIRIIFVRTGSRYVVVDIGLRSDIYKRWK